MGLFDKPPILEQFRVFLASRHEKLYWTWKDSVESLEEAKRIGRQAVKEGIVWQGFKIEYVDFRGKDETHV